ncbi:MAG: sugar-binding domain-containing protein [Anaerolineae bacterium]
MLQLDDSRWELLARVAHLYYKKNRTQAEIARLLDISRPQVSRLLAESRESGVVEINIRYPKNTLSTVRQDLLDTFELKSASILSASDLGYAQLQEQLGILAARQLETELADGMTMGISWNTGVYQVVKALQAARRENVTVVQLTGAVGTINPLIDGPDLTRWLAQSLGAQYKYLHAPMLVESAATRDVLMKDRSVREPLVLLENMDIALVGIGSLIPTLAGLLRAGLVSEGELREIVRQGGVGEVCGYHYNLRGEVLPLELHERIIGVTLDMLKKAPFVIGVGGSIHKASAILGALRLGILDCLITDEIAARAVLKMAGQD